MDKTLDKAGTESTAPAPVQIDPAASAKLAGLRYITDDRPGIRREKRGENFVYLSPKGEEITDEQTLKRIRSLAIPPAYTEVWISPLINGHLQATGRDARGRKQYRYHPRWRAVRDETKYNRVIAFGHALPQIRERVNHDMKLPGMKREKILATVVRLLETTLIRVGNEEYAKQNKSFGLTTMRDRHVKIEGTTVRFKFRGKSGKDHVISLQDRQLAKIVQKSRDIPGYELFQYIDENGDHRTIDSSDVNEYLREITGQEFSAKDFRTFAGTVLAALALQGFEPFSSQTQAKKNIVEAIKTVSERLGNTPSICRKCYVHPVVLDAYLEGTMLESLQNKVQEELEEPGHKLKPEEEAVLRFLEARLQQEEEHDARKKRAPKKSA